MRRLVLLVVIAGSISVVPADASAILGGRAETVEELPHLEAMHEWWYAAIQSSGAGPCGPWQAMVSLVRDAEAAGDHLFFTTVFGEDAVDRSHEYPPGSMSYATSGDLPASEYQVRLDSSSVHVERFTGVRRFQVSAGDAVLDVIMTKSTQTLWRRRSAEGWGAIEVIMAPRATVTGSLTVAGKVCPVNGLGYFEHVWGSWSRVPMWGVDFLSAHAGEWSVVARRTPMRGETRGFPTNALAEPVMIVTDGTHIYEAATTSFAMTEGGEHPDLLVPLPESYTVIGTGFEADFSVVTLTVGEPTLASVILPLTSSGILEGWAAASITIDAVTHAGTAEVEMQRYGTRYPH